MFAPGQPIGRRVTLHRDCGKSRSQRFGGIAIQFTSPARIQDGMPGLFVFIGHGGIRWSPWDSNGSDRKLGGVYFRQNFSQSNWHGRRPMENIASSIWLLLHLMGRPQE